MATNPTPQPTPKPKTTDMKCHVRDQPHGGLSVTFQIEEFYAKRIKLRAGPMPLDRYIWENIIKRAVADHVC